MIVISLSVSLFRFTGHASVLAIASAILAKESYQFTGMEGAFFGWLATMIFSEFLETASSIASFISGGGTYVPVVVTVG